MPNVVGCSKNGLRSGVSMAFDLYPTPNQNVTGDSTIKLHVIAIRPCKTIVNCSQPAVPLLLFWRDEADGALLLRLRWRHELSDGGEDLDDGFVLGVDALFERGELAGKFLVGGEHLAHAHERAHDVHAHLGCPGGC